MNMRKNCRKRGNESSNNAQRRIHTVQRIHAMQKRGRKTERFM